MTKGGHMSAHIQRSRRSGVRLDPDRLDFELGRRGLTARRLSEFAKVHEVTLSRARHGHPVAERTLGRITHALLGVPPLVGADLLLAEPESKKTVDNHWSASGGSPPVMKSPIGQTGPASKEDDGAQEVAI
jgi:hypothetical protein